MKETIVKLQGAHMCRIEKGLYLGSLGAASKRTILKALNVTRILCITPGLAEFYPDDFVYKIVSVADRPGANIYQYFNECLAFIDEAIARGGGVLVHCYAGISRSVSVIVAYLMFKNGMSLNEAMRYVKLRRPVASPNPGFIVQLQAYEISLRCTTNTENSNDIRESSSSPPQSVKRKQGSSSPEAHFPRKRTLHLPSVALDGVSDLEYNPVKHCSISIEKQRQESIQQQILESTKHVPCAVPASTINADNSVVGVSPGDRLALTVITHKPLKEQAKAFAQDAHAKLSKADQAVKVACDERDKAPAALRKELIRVRKELEKEKCEAFKRGYKAGVRSLLTSSEYKKSLSEYLVGGVHAFLQSPSCETLLGSLAARYLDLVPGRLEGKVLDRLEAAEPAAAAKPVGKDTPRE